MLPRDDSKQRFRCPFRLLALTLFVALAAQSFYAFQDVQSVSGDEVKQLIKQADKLIKKGNNAEAEKLLKRAVELSSAESAAKLKLAYLYVKMRRLVEAYDLSFPIAKAEPKNAYAFAVLGATLLGAGRFEDARRIFYTAIKNDREEALAWAGVGMLDFYENRIGESLENLREAVFLEPFDADFLFALAQISARAEKYRDAAKAYEDFLRVSRNTDDERRDRIKGLINFLRFLGSKQALYTAAGPDRTTVKFDLVGNRPIIQMRVNDHDEPLNFVLDTGSGISVISDETAKRLNIDPITRGGFAKGIGGNGKFEIVYGFLRQVSIGDVKMRSVPVYIRKFHSDGHRIDGYIGLSLISKFLTTIDYGALTFALERKDVIASTVVDEGISLPLRLTSSGFLSGEVQLEGVEARLNFIVDTGASISVISDDVAALEAIVPHAKGEKMRVIGSAGVTDDVPSFLLPRVSFGTHSRKSVAAIALDLDLINEVSGFEQAGILGGNFLRNYRMTFDFKNSKVTFVSINQEN